MFVGTLTGGVGVEQWLILRLNCYASFSDWLFFVNLSVDAGSGGAAVSPATAG